MRLLANGKLTASFDAECVATRLILDRVGDKWSVLVVVSLRDGAKRFNAIRRDLVGISQRVLTTTLRSLERDGLLTRTVFPTNPPQVEYALTKLGKTLLQPVSVLAAWAQAHRADIHEAQQAFERAAAPKPKR